mmetsp:Transcript_2737/g.7416  ORF Transcript_2737/g.7416 Transcript_2737/m.7416 type:complete len:325 (-) Transcript_2737:299-1273(-)
MCASCVVTSAPTATDAISTSSSAPTPASVWVPPSLPGGGDGQNAMLLVTLVATSTPPAPARKPSGVNPPSCMTRMSPLSPSPSPLSRRSPSLAPPSSLVLALPELPVPPTPRAVALRKLASSSAHGLSSVPTPTSGSTLLLQQPMAAAASHLPDGAAPRCPCAVTPRRSLLRHSPSWQVLPPGHRLAPCGVPVAPATLSAAAARYLYLYSDPQQACVYTRVRAAASDTHGSFLPTSLCTRRPVPVNRAACLCARLGFQVHASLVDTRVWAGQSVGVLPKAHRRWRSGRGGQPGEGAQLAIRPSSCRCRYQAAAAAALLPPARCA